MRHVRDYRRRRFPDGTVHRLPDGRRFVNTFDQPPKIIDTEGNEITPSASEVIALEAISGMSFPRLQLETWAD